MSFIDYKNTPIFYNDIGKGSAVVLLHGFLENSSMWDDAVATLSKKNRVITIDLLGHGKTNCLGYIHTMTEMANTVHTVLKHLNLRRYFLIGHSMGGYVALDFAKRYTKNVKGLCLLNSTYEADDAERKQIRTRANKMVQNNFENVVRMSFANLFSNKSKQLFKAEFEIALNEALKTPLQGYIAAQEGMKLREDTSSFFANAPFLKTIILGKKDTILNHNNISQYAENHNIPMHLFSEGHMSYIENRDKFLHQLVCFIEKR